MLRVQEVPGSIPGQAHFAEVLLVCVLVTNCINTSSNESSVKTLSHLILFECKLTLHTPDVHRMRIESVFTLLKFETKL